MKHKIGIFGSAENNDDSVIKSARELGMDLGRYKNKIILLTGATTGLTDVVARIAAKHGVEIWGFPPVTNMDDLKKLTPQLDFSIYKKLTFIPQDYAFRNNSQVCRKYRNVTTTVTCDAGIIISGRWGTTNEFTNLYDMVKVIGVITQTGGISDELDRLNKKLKKKSEAQLVFDNDSKKLIAKLFNLLKH